MNTYTATIEIRANDLGAAEDAMAEIEHLLSDSMPDFSHIGEIGVSFTQQDGHVRVLRR